MFIDNQVVKKVGGEDRYDKFAIASTIFDVSFKGATCSAIQSHVLNNCDGCNLRYICREIDEVVEEYIELTTAITASFNFGK